MRGETRNHPLPQFLRDLLACPPRHGGGVHLWLYKVARQLHAHRGESDICALLTAAVSDCGRIVPTSEIANAVRNAERTKWTPNKTGARGGNPAKPKWPPLNVEQRQAVLHEMDGFGLVDLRAMSQLRWDDAIPHTHEIIPTIFPHDCLLCAGRTKTDAKTKPLEEWLAEDMARLQFVVPSTMSKTTGMNLEGKVSTRCLDNTGTRRFLIIEFDNGTQDEQSALLAWLAHRAPLALVVFSGGKSLHGWFYCGGASEEKLSGFFRLACLLGADRSMWPRCQMVRMPDGWRTANDGNGTRQIVFFFNPQSVL